MVCSMSDAGSEGREERRDDPAESAEKGIDPGPPPTPFDHPLFLPALLFGGMLWFGYDGWITTDPEMLEHQSFNRWGFGVLTLLTAWFGYKGWNEWQSEKAAKREASSDEAASRPDPL